MECQGGRSYTSQRSGLIVVVQLVLTPAGQYHVGRLHGIITTNKKLSYRRETARSIVTHTTMG